MNDAQLTTDQAAEIERVKRLRPCMIAYGAVNPKTGEFFVASVATRRKPNQLVREGWLVWTT